MSQAKPLSHEEITKVIPLLIKILKMRSPLYAPEVKLLLQDECDKNSLNYRCHDTRLRQMINYLRTHSILPVIGDKRGYRIAQSKEEMIIQAESLRDRAKSIMAAANGLMNITI